MEARKILHGFFFLQMMLNLVLNNPGRIHSPSACISCWKDGGTDTERIFAIFHTPVTSVMGKTDRYETFQ